LVTYGIKVHVNIALLFTWDEVMYLLAFLIFLADEAQITKWNVL
jgi:hypothetical protein